MGCYQQAHRCIKPPCLNSSALFVCPAVCPKGSAYNPGNVTIPATCIPCKGSTYNEVIGAGATETYCMSCDLPKAVNGDKSECDCPAPFKTVQATPLSDPQCGEYQLVVPIVS